MNRFISPFGWVILSAAVAALVVTVALFWLQGHNHNAATVAKAGGIIAQGQAAAGRDAVGVVVGNADTQAATDQTTKENRDAILNAPGAQAPVDPAVGDAGRRAVCMRQSARDLPACKRLLNPGS